MIHRTGFIQALSALVLSTATSWTWAASAAPVAAEHGMVVSAHRLATLTGVDVLRKGGNAIDAAVAVAYDLAVVYPAAGNLGGGGFMTLQLADGRKTFIDFRERAPLAATPDMYLGAEGQVRAGASTRGHLAVAVPGTVAGLELALRRYGSGMPRASLMAPAIAHARRGFVLAQGDIDLLSVATEDFRKDPASAAVFLRSGQALRVGQRLVQSDLARTLTRIQRFGADGFYRGPVAQALLDSNRAGGGILSSADLLAYTARERAPAECDYRGLHIVSAPPPSSGGVILCEMLQILQAYPLKEMGWRSARAVHLQIEAMRHAYRDRNLFLGDPDHVVNPLARLMSPEHAESVRAAILPDRAGRSSEIRSGAEAREGTHTTHYSILDRHGNAASVTYTLNDWFGARVTAAGTGVLLNNEMDDFTLKPGVPNLYGLVQGQANAIAPGKRPLSSMAPTVISRDGQVLMVLGTPGGSRIISSVLLTLLNVVDYGMTVQEAVDAPRFHQQWWPESTSMERFALGPDALQRLAEMGHQIVEVPPANHLAAILVGAPALGGRAVGSSRYYGANDPRRGTGLALGY